MADKPDITQKKTLRLKKSGGSTDDTAPAQDTSTPQPVPAVMGGGAQAAPATKVPGNKLAAILALLATLVFAALVLIQYRELQTYKYAFPQPQVQPLP